ncbi:MAG: MBL fold metallo-hydrolase [Proteobacteria bacterium]|nr:MBL fold metallo-hydrolase [Pseudomonadota bacterium]
MIEEVLPNLVRIEIPLPGSPLKSLNSYVIKASDRNLIIDTGLNRRECLGAMQAGLRQLDVDLGETDFFITHLHADHFGLVSRLVTNTSKIYFNRPDTEIMKTWGGWESMLDYASMNGFPENELRAALHGHPAYKYSLEWIPDLSILGDGDTIRIGDYRFKCVETPGHTRGHTCLYEPTRKILVSGDHILNDITPNIQCWSDQGNPLKNYLASLDKVYELGVNLVLPGHRRLFRNYKERIQELKRHHKKRADEIRLILGRGSRNAFQVASEMTWDIDYESWNLFPPAQKWFATGEAIAHLRYLEERGMVFRERDEKMITFTTN